ncbi:DUF1592 domain-containing protein [Nannocystis bainbridge]|uniref:DUF1592 domain-containing protein n=1 Tax=Nannocystis bainbridge TaxID=2995303 RepID=A0ABT5E112_9BACT|nr:DUF1592 domain-containing protein [Nannocystis bainbridge]MDC0719113.1 DUF1592 domain-containing protein [Nannocystis bainbridge]
MRRGDSYVFGALLAALLGASACYQGVSANADGSAGTTTLATTGDLTGDPAPTTSDSDSDGDAPDAPQAVPGPTLRRLTAAEFTHAVQDLLGPVSIGAVEADSSQDGFFAVGAARVALSPAGVAKYEQAIGDATAQAFSDPARVAQILRCVPTQLDDVPCMRDALATFGRRAWRRPLTSVELDRYLGIAAAIGGETGDVVVGLRHAVWALLQAPHFLYRVELGLPSPDDGGRLKFTAWEMASRLAFTLWNTVPDEALLDAAEADLLADSAGVHAQAVRMLADPRARQGVHNFITELYGLWALGEKVKDDTLFPEWTPTLKAVMRDELLARVEDVVFDQPADFFSLYDGQKVFVNNELAKIYGLDEVQPDGFRAAMLPPDSPRRGLIGSALVLAMNSLPARTSATERGQFIAESLLCRTVPPPPPTVDTNLDDGEMQDPGPKTLREKLEPHRADPACSGCHNITDPLGLALEHFDTVGRWRPTDQGLTIDASGELDGQYFADGSELALLLREHPVVANCLVRKLYTYAGGRLPLPRETDTVAEIEDELALSGNRFDRLLVALVTHDDFRFAHPAGTVVAGDDSEGDKP